MNRRNLVVVGAAMSVIALGLAAWSASRHWGSRNVAPPVTLNLPNDLKSLVTQDGKRFSFQDLKGRTVALNFIFTHCPSSCPLQTKALTEVQRAISKNPEARVQFVSVSMDPARDTPSVLKRYASSLGADLSNWSFVTGAGDEITWLHQHYNAQVKATGDGQFDHRVAVYLLDAKQGLLQTYAAQPLDQRRLIDEIQIADRLLNKS